MGFFFLFFFVGYGSSKRMWLNKTNRIGLWVIFSFIWAGADIGYFMGWGGVWVLKISKHGVGVTASYLLRRRDGLMTRWGVDGV